MVGHESYYIFHYFGPEDWYHQWHISGVPVNYDVFFVVARLLEGTTFDLFEWANSVPMLESILLTDTMFLGPYNIDTLLTSW